MSRGVSIHTSQVSNAFSRYYFICHHNNESMWSANSSHLRVDKNWTLLNSCRLLSLRLLPPMADRLSTQAINRSSSAPATTPLYLQGLPITPDVADANRVFVSPDPASKPSDLHHVQLNRCSAPGYRFVRSTNPEEILMFVEVALLTTVHQTRELAMASCSHFLNGIHYFQSSRIGWTSANKQPCRTSGCISFSYSTILGWRRVFKDRISLWFWICG